MINTRELQLGDWVNYIGAYHDEESRELIQLWKDPIPIKVTFITPDAIQYEDEDGCYECANYELHPIPLTAAILEKNGIKLDGVGDNGVSTPPRWRNRFEKWVLRTQWRDTFIWYDRTAKYWHLHDMGAAKLIYVHQLQHALRLCGIEKEIEL